VTIMTRSRSAERGWGHAGPVVVLMSAWLGMTAPAAAGEGGIIYASAWQTAGFSTLGTDLQSRLSSRFDYGLNQVEADADVLRLVRADPRHVGFVQRDVFVDRVQRSPGEFDRLEFYGNVAACLVVVTRKGSPIQTYEGLVAGKPDRTVTLDIGPTTGRVAATFEILRGMDPDLGKLRLEHRGGSRAVSRVVTGDADAALLIAYAPFRVPALDGPIEQDQVDLVPLVSRTIVAAAHRQNAPYALREIELGEAGWLRSARPYHTTCTSLGVVVNEKADARLSEAVAQSMLQTRKAADSGYSLAWFQDLVSGIFSRLALLVRDAGEVAIATVLGTRGSAGNPGPRPGEPDNGGAVTLRPAASAASSRREGS
jgi:hypothetical protein